MAIADESMPPAADYSAETAPAVSPAEMSAAPDDVSRGEIEAGGENGDELFQPESRTSAPPPAAEPNRAETIFRALARAYPDRIESVEFREGDWAIQVYGEWFYYADGRLLPASLRAEAAEYDPQSFYTYERELPPWKALSAEESARMKEQLARRRANPAKRSPHFFDTLWRARNRAESYEHVKQLRFLGKPVLVHYTILTQLSLVEERILRVSKTSAAVRQWIASLKTVEGWNWRAIAQTQSRSNHSYGAAIDLLPRSLGGLATYWQWTARNTSEWWNVPYTRRFHPPEEVIAAFEAFGFIWGGKWRYFDTMHFEYRPEIFILSGIPMTDLKELR